MTKYSSRWLCQPLSDHQTSLLRHYVAGWSSDMLCAKFNITPSTLASTLTTIQNKFSAPTRRAMIIFAIYDNLFSLEELLPLSIIALNGPAARQQNDHEELL